MMDQIHQQTTIFLQTTDIHIYKDNVVDIFSTLKLFVKKKKETYNKENYSV